MEILSIWTEKYRPKEFSDIYGQEEIISKIRAFVEQKNMPHLLFVGPAGVGKTSLALVIAKKLFGDLWHDNLLELNASDERGIDVVRVKVKDFARTRSIGNTPFKIIHLDECDALTKEAQQALRRIMENYAQTCRFILSANYSSKILDPIQSRCAVFRFKPLQKDDILHVINYIAAQEGLILTNDVREAFVQVCQGDCRRLENIMQSCAAVNKELTTDTVFSMSSVAKPKEMQEVLNLALQNKFIDARKRLFEVLQQYSLSGIDAIKQIEHEIWELDISDKKKVELIDKCGEIEFRMVEGSDEILQIEVFLAQVAAVGLSN
ncbi:MAG: replication factor C small subunit [Nanoarchaeota archaeon]